MAIFSKESLKSLFGGDYQTPDSSLILESFTFQEMDYIRTPSLYLSKPVYKKVWTKTSQANFEYNLSCYRTAISRSQAKGLLHYQRLGLFND